MIRWLAERRRRREREAERQHELDIATINAAAKVGMALVNQLFHFPRLPVASQSDDLKCGAEFADCSNEPHVCDSAKGHEGPHVCAGGTNGRL